MSSPLFSSSSASAIGVLLPWKQGNKNNEWKAAEVFPEGDDHKTTHSCCSFWSFSFSSSSILFRIFTLYSYINKNKLLTTLLAVKGNFLTSYFLSLPSQHTLLSSPNQQFPSWTLSRESETPRTKIRNPRQAFKPRSSKLDKHVQWIQKWENNTIEIE